MSTPITVHSLPALKDNYIHVLVARSAGEALVIDPGEAGPVLDFLNTERLRLAGVLLTHHHHDHIGGLPELQKKLTYDFPCFCSPHDRPRIPGTTHTLIDGASWSWQGHKVSALSTPGHTHGAITYHWSDLDLVFTGDTLFTLGCGRLFEGTPAEMYASLQKIRALPPTTQVYCGHEYGQQNLGFSLWLSEQPSHSGLYLAQELEELRSDWQEWPQNPLKRSVPSPLAREIRLNPFLKAPSLKEFTQIRQLKDDFRLEHYTALG